MNLRAVYALGKVRDGRIPSPARCKRALPGDCAFPVILFAATLRPAGYQFLVSTPEAVRG
jgi:hypothetical protein